MESIFKVLYNWSCSHLIYAVGLTEKGKFIDESCGLYKARQNRQIFKYNWISKGGKLNHVAEKEREWKYSNWFIIKVFSFPQEKRREHFSWSSHRSDYLVLYGWRHYSRARGLFSLVKIKTHFERTSTFALTDDRCSSGEPSNLSFICPYLFYRLWIKYWTNRNSIYKRIHLRMNEWVN